MSSLDRSELVLAEYLTCERELARAQAERDAAIERAARAEEEVRHLRAALWLAQHPAEAHRIIDTTAHVSEVYAPPNTSAGE